MAAMITTCLFVKNTFYDEEPSVESYRTRSSSVPPEFSPKSLEVSARPVDESKCELEPPNPSKSNPPPFGSLQLQRERGKSWADESTDDDAESTDDELLRTASDASKYTSYASDTDMWSICSDAPSPVSTCATPKCVQKTPLSRNYTPFISARQGVRQTSAQYKAVHQDPPRVFVAAPASPFVQDASDIVKALQQAVVSNDVGTAKIESHAAGWTLHVQVNGMTLASMSKSDAHGTVLELLKEILIDSAEKATCAVIVGARRQPFAYEDNGWSAILSATPDEERACSDAYLNGGSKSCCFRTVTVLVA